MGDDVDAVERFEAMLAAGRDNALLRFTLGVEYLKRDELDTAIVHFQRAVELDEGYAPAWQQLGRAFERAERMDEAVEAWRRGVAAADERGNVQAAKVMRVWLRRSERSAGDGE